MGPRPHLEPVRTTPLPQGPWQEISVDLLEIPGNNHLLVVVDYYSRWIEAILLKKTDAQHVIRSMEAIFRTHGLPEAVRSDNGPPFASREFEGFLDYLGIEHKKGVPYWPQSNGQVERCNETVLKIIRIAQLEGRDWKKALKDFLFHYRTTPRTVTGVSPAELLMGRKLRDKIPKLQFPSDRATETQWQQLLRDRNARAKLRQKEYADKCRSAQRSKVEEGDQVLLQKNRENKLTPNFEPEPYKVIQRNGNAVILENAEGVTKMRNVAQMKKFIQTNADRQPPEALEPKPDPPEPKESTDMPSKPEGVQKEDNPPQVPVLTPPKASPGGEVAPRPQRIRQVPARFNDFIVKHK